MTEAREAILAKLGSAAASSPKPNISPAPGTSTADQSSHAEQVRKFVEKAEKVGCECRRTVGFGNIPKLVGEFLRSHNLPNEVSIVPALENVATEWCDSQLISVELWSTDCSCLTGITAAKSGVAETGTLVLSSSYGTPTLAAFLPENSVVILETKMVCARYEDAWSLIVNDTINHPRSVNFVTGPSRTGDIGQKIELGAHGPKRLLIILVDDAHSGQD